MKLGYLENFSWGRWRHSLWTPAKSSCFFGSPPPSSLKPCTPWEAAVSRADVLRAQSIHIRTSGPGRSHPCADTDRKEQTSSFAIAARWDRESCESMAHLRNSVSTENEISSAIPGRSLGCCVCVFCWLPAIRVCSQQGVFGVSDWHIQSFWGVPAPPTAKLRSWKAP